MLHDVGCWRASPRIGSWEANKRESAVVTGCNSLSQPPIRPGFCIAMQPASFCRQASSRSVICITPSCRGVLVDEGLQNLRSLAKQSQPGGCPAKTMTFPCFAEALNLARQTSAERNLIYAAVPHSCCLTAPELQRPTNPGIWSSCAEALLSPRRTARLKWRGGNPRGPKDTFWF